MGFFYVLVTLVAAAVYAEVAGYFLHILLHSDRVRFLSKAHMIHHLLIYKPKENLRPVDHYLVSTEGRASLLAIGLEWLVPVILIMGFGLGVMTWLQISWPYQLVFTLAALAWGYFMFGYMHDSMHIKNFWMENHRILGPWFRKIRRLHDIHHMTIDDTGLMCTNYGICFFFFDGVFGTYKSEPSAFNDRGLEKAYERYAYIQSS